MFLHLRLLFLCFTQKSYWSLFLSKFIITWWRHWPFTQLFHLLTWLSTLFCTKWIFWFLCCLLYSIYIWLRNMDLFALTGNRSCSLNGIWFIFDDSSTLTMLQSRFFIKSICYLFMQWLLLLFLSWGWNINWVTIARTFLFLLIQTAFHDWSWIEISI